VPPEKMRRIRLPGSVLVRLRVAPDRGTCLPVGAAFVPTSVTEATSSVCAPPDTLSKASQTNLKNPYYLVCKVLIEMLLAEPER